MPCSVHKCPGTFPLVKTQEPYRATWAFYSMCNTYTHTHSASVADMGVVVNHYEHAAMLKHTHRAHLH